MTVTLDGVTEPLKSRIERLLADGGGKYWLSSAFRSYAQQLALWTAHQQDPVHHAAANYPGTSMHELGKAVDVGHDRTHDEDFKRDAASHGLWIRYPDKEPWHCELDVNWKDPTPAPSQEDDDVAQPKKLIAPSGRGWWVLQPDGSVETHNFIDADPIPFHGSAFDYPDAQKAHQPFDSIQALGPSDADGYAIFSQSGDWCGKFRKS